nr:S9 family peptidase [Actinomycetota bacterium]
MTRTEELIPRDVLFGNPERVQPRISPDGRRLAYIAPVDGVLNVWVGDLGGDEFQPVTEDRDRGIRQYFWAHDDRHLLYLQDKGGDENWRLYAVDLDTGAVRDLTPFDEVQAQVVDASKHHPDRILVGLNKDNPELHDVYRLELASGELAKVVENPGFLGWVADADLQVRCGSAPTPEGGMNVMVRDDESDDWRTLLQVTQEDALTTGVVGFTADGGGLHVITSEGANAGRLVRMDLGGPGEEVIAEDPTYDV